MRSSRRALTLALAMLTAVAVIFGLAPGAGADSGAGLGPGAPTGQAKVPPMWDDATARVADKVAAIHRIRELADRKPDHFAGVSTKGPDDVTVNLVLGTPVAPELAAMERDAAANGIVLKRKYRKYSLRDLMQVQTALSKNGTTGAGTGPFRVGINPDTNSVDVGFPEPSTSVVREVRSTYGDRVSVVPVEPMRAAYGRFNDVPLYYAGNRIRVDGALGPCTSAFTITNLYGYHFALTAGHCAPATGRPTARLLRENNTTYDQDLGTVDYRRLGNGNLDNALVGTNRYAPRMWSSFTLNDDNHQYLVVHAAHDSCDGCQVYLNGSYTGVRLATLRGAPFCADVSGNYSCGLQRVESAGTWRICQPGDSGGPVFAHDGRGGIVAVGIITAVGNTAGTVCAYTRITPILAYWVSTITTG